MAPKKNVQKLNVKTLDHKPKRVVRKKPPGKSLTSKLPAPSMIDLSSPFTDIKDPEQASQKPNKAKLGNKINLNRTNSIKACKAPADDPNDADSVPPLTKKTKACNKKNQNKTKIIHNHDVTNDSINLHDAPAVAKILKRKRIKKQAQNEIKIMFADEVTDGTHNPGDVSSKIKKTKGNTRQNKKKINIIIDREGDILAISNERKDGAQDTPPKIKKTKSTYKRKHSEINVMLANEVVRSAFHRKPKIVKKPTRVGRQKKIVPIPADSAENVCSEPTKVLQGHENIQDVAKKKETKNVLNRKRASTALICDDISQSTTITKRPCNAEETPRKKMKLSLRRKPLKPLVEQSSSITETLKEGKQEAQETTLIAKTEISPNSNETTAPSNTNNATSSHKPRSRKNSGTSTSTCYSWTKDISSSSAVTCVTVKSNDFIRFDKRLPIVKLTNVDHQIVRTRSVDDIFEENTFNSHNEALECPSDCNSVLIADLNISETLNLSTSSLTSVTTNRAPQNNFARTENKDLRLIKLRQGLDNLSCKMKHFDLEIINWIGYQNENKHPTTKKFNARVFEVLDYENNIIKYCKEIKRVLAGDKCDEQSVDNIEHSSDLNGNVRSKSVSDGCNKENGDSVETISESQNDNLRKRHGGGDRFNERKSFEKDSDIQDNDDDDDALSLFAESLTGLESSRKNSSFAISVSNLPVNDKSVDQHDSRVSNLMNERVCEPISNFEEGKKQSSHPNISNIKNQSTVTSAACNKASDSRTFIKLQTDQRTEPSKGVCDSLCETLKDPPVDFSYDDLPNIPKNSNTNNRFNARLFNSSEEFLDVDNRSAIDTSVNSNDGWNDYQSAKVTSNSFDFNCFQKISQRPVNISQNWNNKISEVQGNSDKNSVDETENSSFVISSDQLNQSSAFPLAMGNNHAVGSNIFNGVCIFNLVSQCKHMMCVFSHKNIEVDFVKSKLQEMNEETFIRECKYFLKWHILKNKYGVCFVEETIRRNMTVSLLHMVKHFMTKNNRKYREENNAFTTEIIEITLLHLNDADMESYADTLRSEVKPNICMCDHFMKVISETQNFSRFKNVFIKLTLFIYQAGRSFKLHVATQVLERLCILPYDDALAHALMKIIEKTHPSIFSAPMMGLLENQLLRHNSQLYKKLMSLKLQCNSKIQDIVSPSTQSSHIAPSNLGHQASTPVNRADSPDTTNTDFVSKMVEPVITRTITINRTINTSNLNLSDGSKGSEAFTNRSERYKSEQTRQPYPPPLMSLRPPRPQRQVYNRVGFSPRAFNSTHIKFRRRLPQGHMVKDKYG